MSVPDVWKPQKQLALLFGLVGAAGVAASCVGSDIRLATAVEKVFLSSLAFSGLGYVCGLILRIFLKDVVAEVERAEAASQEESEDSMDAGMADKSAPEQPAVTK